LKILEDNFNSKGFNLSLVKREGDVAIYKKTLEDSESGESNFEVIAIKRHNGYEIAGIKMPPAEMYPSNTQWGDWAYTCTSREDADKRFIQLKDKLTNYKATSVLASGEKRKRGRPRKSNILPAPPAEIHLTENQMEVV
jgi:hypothetical protein